MEEQTDSNGTQTLDIPFEERAPSPAIAGGVDVDTATIVSISSSCVILISGCIAVICLIAYMKKNDSIIRYQNAIQTNSVNACAVCAKCGATVPIAVAAVATAATSVATDSKRVVSSLMDSGFAQSHKTANSVTTTADRQPISADVALYAISCPPEDPLLASARAQCKSGNEDSLLGFICGHITDSQTTLSTTGQPINSKDYSNMYSQPRRHPALPSCQVSCQPSCHSQCSSNQEELINIYSKNAKQCLRMSFESFGDIYESISDRETPTDPGIREFSNSPPKPNERRIGVVQRIGLRDAKDDSSTTTSSSETTPTNQESRQHSIEFSSEEKHMFGAIPRFRARKPMWKLCSQSETIKCLSNLSQFNENFEMNGLSTTDDDNSSEDDVNKGFQSESKSTSKANLNLNSCETIDC